MEDGVDVPGHGEVKLGSYRRNEFCNEKGAVTFRGQFDCSMGYGEVLAF
jgi:hypothetical protein